ncbi:hypothetical protein [Nitrospira sp. Nam74]
MRQKAIDSLNDEIAKKTDIVAMHEGTMQWLQSQHPKQEEVHKPVEEQTAPDPALIAAAQRIAGGRVRVASEWR